MKKLVLLFTVMLFTVIFVSCDKEDLFQNADQEVTTGVDGSKEYPELSDGTIPTWVSEYVTLEEYNVLNTLSQNYNIDYSFITKDFYENSKDDIYKYLNDMCKEISSTKIDNIEKIDLYIMPNSNNNVSTRSDGMHSQTEVIAEFDGISIHCSFSFDFYLRPNFQVISVLEKKFFATPKKYDPVLEGVGTVRPSNNATIDITFSGIITYNLGGEVRERPIDSSKTVLARH